MNEHPAEARADADGPRLQELRAAAWSDLAAGRTAGACARVEAILSIWPDDPETTEIHAVALAQTNRLEEALAKLDDLIGRTAAEDDLGRRPQPDAPPRHGSAAGATPRVHAHRANVLAMMGRTDDAIAAYTATLTLEPTHRSALLNLASLELESGAWPHAGEHLRALLEIDPDNAAAHYTMGRLLQRVGKPEGAEAAYRRAVERDPAQASCWNNLGNLYKDLGRFDEAAGCYEAALAIDPDRPVLRHLVAALRGQTIERADPQYVRDLFDRYAGQFDTDLVEKLGYRVPESLVELLEERTRPDPQRPISTASADQAEHGELRRDPRKRIPPFEAALDLGCGTGLLGRQLRPLCAQLHGVDLSRGMLAEAAKTGIYDSLTTAEILEFLGGTRHRFDLIAATDVLIYLGNLDPLFRTIRRCLAPGGWVALSTERLGEGTYQIRPSGRFAHSRRYVLETARRYRLGSLAVREVPCRRERGEAVAADLYLFASPPPDRAS